jgi:hypothetical protein
MSNYKTFSFTVVGIVTTMAIVCHLGVQALDKATAQQCRTHAWPQAAHQIHMDWCADNGYATHPPINIMAKVTYAQLFKFRAPSPTKSWMMHRLLPSMPTKTSVNLTTKF